MKKAIAAIAGLAALGLVSAASAATIEDMLGKWQWEGFTVEVTKCEATGVCSKVIAGPKNVGMEMIRSKLEPKGDAWVGKVAHPQTGEVYNTKMTFENHDSWKMDGCTDAGACATGTFTRVK